MNIYLVHPFQVGSSEGFAPWLENAEKRVQETNIDERPKTFDEALKFEEKACLFLKEIVKGKQYLKLKYYLSKYIFSIIHASIPRPIRNLKHCNYCAWNEFISNHDGWK